MATPNGPNSPSLLSLLPFILLLSAIAGMPFVHKKFWDQFYPHCSTLLALVTIFESFSTHHSWTPTLHALVDYFGFMAIVCSLFLVTSGVHLSVEGVTSPLRNALFLLVGAVLSNLIGTTGASMLLIRPWLQLNHRRTESYHLVFFIFIISNCGGCLTPIGDPPLFLGFLKGIPFFWSLQHLWPAWLSLNLGLILVFWLIDHHSSPKHSPPVPSLTIKLEGFTNIFLLLPILASFFLPSPWREGLMLLTAVLSWLLTPRSIHQANQFTFHPLQEVGWLFLGIFCTMIPALEYLQCYAHTLTLSSPLHYYLATGSLSAFLDNAPTYLTLLTTALASQSLSLSQPSDVLQSLLTAPQEIVAISLGAVFFGAATYVGNGPNFMVKAIAEQAQLPVPSFFGYLIRFTFPILLPLLLMIGWLFAR